MLVVYHPLPATGGDYISAWRGSGLFITLRAFGDASKEINGTSFHAFLFCFEGYRLRNAKGPHFFL